MQPVDIALKTAITPYAFTNLNNFRLLLVQSINTVCTQVVGNYNGSTKKYEEVEGRQIYWGGGRTSPPPDIPECGFDGSGCPEDRESLTCRLSFT